MHYCKKCRRPLKPKEKDFCPACQLEKWHKKKIWAGIFGGVAVAVVGIIALVGGKGNDNA